MGVYGKEVQPYSLLQQYVALHCCLPREERYLGVQREARFTALHGPARHLIGFIEDEPLLICPQATKKQVSDDIFMAPVSPAPLNWSTAVEMTALVTGYCGTL